MKINKDPNVGHHYMTEVKDGVNLERDMLLKLKWG